jgi:tRNA (mo5U34)-methyltransferase
MTQTGARNTLSKAELQSISDSVKFWWHSVNLGQSVVTPGEKSVPHLARELASMKLPELKGKTVLDIGAWDGFYSFQAEKRGAARVVALDHFVWSTDLPNRQAYERACKRDGSVPLPIRQTPNWKPDALPGKLGFDSAHRAFAE